MKRNLSFSLSFVENNIAQINDKRFTDKFIKKFRRFFHRNDFRGKIHWNELIGAVKGAKKGRTKRKPRAVDLTNLETKLHLFPIEFAHSNTYVMQYNASKLRTIVIISNESASMQPRRNELSDTDLARKFL